jgi:fatty acid desaturase
MDTADDYRLPSLRRGVSAGAQWREGAFVIALASAVAGTFVAIVESRSLLTLSLLVVFQALLTIQAVLLFHDCMHFAAFSSPRLNSWLGRIIGGFFFWPLTFLRKSHLEHHRYAGTLERDTEALHLSYEDAGRYPGGHLLQWLGARWIGILVYTPCLQMGHFIKWLSSLSPGRSTAPKGRAELRGFAVDVAVMAAFWVPINLQLASRGLACKGFLLGFLAPAILGMMGVYWASKPLHTGMLSRVPEGASRIERVLFTSRSFEANPVLRAIFCNLNYHIEHHLYPGVSRWELGALARSLRAPLREIARRERLPLIVHKSYLRWNRDFRRHGTQYNMLRTPEDVVTHNSIFEIVR